VVETFYQTFGQVSFTLLGLWMAVAGARYDRWAPSPAHRRMAYGVFLQFALPAVMSVFTLVAPDEPVVWHVTFAVAAGLGVVGMLLLRAADDPRVGRSGLLSAANTAAAVVYAVVAVVALVPSDVLGDALGVDPLRLEAGLLTLLVFLGVNVGWLLFDDAPRPSDRAAGPF
jgi:hypothetical protein